MISDISPPPVELPTVDATCTSKGCDARGTYRLRGSCYNCESEVIGIFTKGHEAIGQKCPICGCRCLHWKGLVK